MIRYLTGDVLYPAVPGHKYIVHVCNDVGGWGRGFVKSLSRRWLEPEQHYRAARKPLELGTNQYVRVEPDITVVNMVAQRGYKSETNPTPLRYGALTLCLHSVNAHIIDTDSTIHMPLIGTGLAGGSWDKISQIINEHVQHDVYVYQLPGEL